TPRVPGARLEAGISEMSRSAAASADPASFSSNNRNLRWRSPRFEWLLQPPDEIPASQLHRHRETTPIRFSNRNSPAPNFVVGRRPETDAHKDTRRRFA